MKHRLLVVDDDARLRALLDAFLSDHGFNVILAANAQEARLALREQAIDLIVLDIMMPGETGLELAQALRDSGGGDMRILMLSAMGDVEDRVDGLNRGADDYLAKPFEPKELLARLQALLRRTNHVQHTKTLLFGDMRFEPSTQKFYKAGEEVFLTSVEQHLLHAFSTHANEPLSRERLVDLSQAGLSLRSVDVQITRLRKKIEDNPKRPRFLQTVRHIGYILRVEA